MRAALQNALDSGYAPKTEHLPLNIGQSVGETRSFGETHADELSTIGTVTDNGHEGSTAINPAALNNNPTPIPTTAPHYNPPMAPPPSGHHYSAPSVPPPSASTGSTSHTATSNVYTPPTTAPPGPGSIPPVPSAPTVAETGVPVVAGTAGPGPATGTLHSSPGGVRDHSTVGYGVGANEHAPAYGGAPTPHESAADEKRRLAAADQTQTTAPPPLNAPSYGQQGGLVASTSTRRPATHESAEDEKRRLEREERERILRQGANTRQDTEDDGTDPSGGAAPPAYQD